MILSKKSIKITVFIIMAIMLCTGCKSNKEGQTNSVDVNSENGVGLYYLNKSEDELLEGPFEFDSSTKLEMVEEIIYAMKVPNSEAYELKPLLNLKLNLMEAEINNESILLDFHKSYLDIEKSKEILIRAGLVKNLTKVPGIEQVTIQVGGESLLNSDGSIVGVMTSKSFVVDTQEDFNSHEKIKVRLYFINSEMDMLNVLSEEVVYNVSSSLEKLIVEELIKGPGNETLNPVMNKDTKLINISTKDGVCYVNFDDGFLLPNEHLDANLTIYSIVNSLAELPGINKVQIQVNGNTDIIYQEKIELNTLFERNLDIVEEMNSQNL